MSSTVTASARLFTAANSESFSIASPTGLSPTTSTDFYLATWVYLTSKPAAFMGLICKYDGGADGGGFYALRWSNTADRFIFGVEESTGVYVTTTANTFGAPSTATWYFVEARYSDSNNAIYISVNRGAEDSAAVTALVNNARPFNIGMRNSGSQYLDGRMQGWMYINGTPSTADRDALYAAGAGVNYAGRPTLASGTYVSWWDGAETSGTAIDAITTNHLTDNNTVTSAAGKVTYTAEDASQFTSANSEYLSISNAAQTGLDPGASPFYICGWMNPTSGTASGYPIIIGKDGFLGNGYSMYFDTTGTLPVWLDRAHSKTCTWGSSLTVSTWYFFECYFDGTNQGLNFNRGTDITTANVTGPTATTAAFLMGHLDGYTNYYNGMLANVVFINGMPTAADRNALFNRGFGVDYSDKPTLNSGTYVSWWELTEASGTRNDSHGTNHLTDNNTVTGNPGVVYDVPAVVPPATLKQSNRLSLGIRLGV